MNIIIACRLMMTCASCLQSPECIWLTSTNISPCRAGLTDVDADEMSPHAIINSVSSCPSPPLVDRHEEEHIHDGKSLPEKICPPEKLCPVDKDCPTIEPQASEKSTPSPPTLPQISTDCSTPWYDSKWFHALRNLLSGILGIIIGTYFDKMRNYMKRKSTLPTIVTNARFRSRLVEEPVE